MTTAHQSPDKQTGYCATDQQNSDNFEGNHIELLMILAYPSLLGSLNFVIDASLSDCWGIFVY
jgi:hypothetical protein